jgi:protein-S-isoprenylcysteine O-methyltransferase
MIRLVLAAIVVLFPVSEGALAIVKRSRGRTAQSEDRGSMRILWLGVAFGVGLAIAAQWIPSARLPGPRNMIRILALVLLLGGLALRWAAILTLGRFFTTDIAVHEGHSVITAGPYRYVRHPSYAGLLLAFLGLGVFFGNWLSLVVLLIPIAFVVIHRIRIEESVLANALGPAYAVYCARTKRLIPGVF